MQLGDLDARVDPERRIEIAERLVEQEHGRLAHDGAADGDPLALPAGEVARPAIEVRGELQRLGGAAHAPVDLRPVRLGEAQAEGHVLVDAHMRIERVGLEHHGDLALGRRHVVDLAPADGDLAGRDPLQPGDQAQKRRFPATRRPDKDDELAILHVEIDVVEDLRRPEGLVDAVERHIGHYFTAPAVRPRTSERENNR